MKKEIKNLLYEHVADKRTKISVFKSENPKVSLHFHRSIEMLYVLSGQLEATVGDKTFTAGEDEIVFVHNYYAHIFKPCENYSKYVFIVPANYSYDVDKRLLYETLPPKLSDREFNREVLRPIFDKMFAENESMPNLAKKGYLDVLMGFALDHYPTFPVEIPGNIEFIVKILQYIDEHYKEPLTLDGVAEAFGYNKYYFSRLFNSYVTESITNYINIVRLQYFMRAARVADSPKISSLAAEAGFESMPTFYRTFAKIYGESPKAYFSKRK